MHLINTYAFNIHGGSDSMTGYGPAGVVVYLSVNLICIQEQRLSQLFILQRNVYLRAKKATLTKGYLFHVCDLSSRNSQSTATREAFYLITEALQK